MDLEQRRLTELTFYCYTRLKADELGLTNVEGLVPNSTYDPYYTVLDIESELLYRPLDDVIPLRCEWDKAKRDFQKYTKVFLSELNEQVCWSGIVAVAASTKMFIRRYRAVNPLFASMFCVTMLETMDELIDNKATAIWISWRKIARYHAETKKPKPKDENIGECRLTTLILTAVILTVGSAGVVKLVELLT